MARSVSVLPTGVTAPRSFANRVANEDLAEANDDYEYYDYDLYYPSGPTQQHSRYQPLGGGQSYNDPIPSDGCIDVQHAPRNGHNFGVYVSSSRRHHDEEQLYQPVSSTVLHGELSYAGARRPPTPEFHDIDDNDAPHIYSHSPALMIDSSVKFVSPIVNEQGDEHYDYHNDHLHLRTPILDNYGIGIDRRDCRDQLEPDRPLRRRTAPPPSFAAIRASTPSTTTTTTYTSVGHPIPPTLPVAGIQATETQIQEDASSFYPSPVPSPAPSGSPSFMVYPRPPSSPPLNVPRLSRPSSSPPSSKKFKKSNRTFASSTILGVSFLDAKGKRSPRIPSIPSPLPSVMRPAQRSTPASGSTPSLVPSFNRSRIPLVPILSSGLNATGTGDGAVNEEEEGDDGDDDEQLPSWMVPLPFAPERSYSNEQSASPSYQHPLSWKQKRMPKEEKAERVRMLEAAFTSHDPQSPSENQLSGSASSASGRGGLTQAGAPAPPKWGGGDGGWERGTVIFRKQGRKTRMAIRWLQFLFAWIAGVACFYAVLIIRPNPAALVSKHWTTYAVYFEAVFSSLLTLHFFFLRRWKPFRVLGKAFFTCCGCCGRTKKPKSKTGKPMRGQSSPARRGKAGKYEDSDMVGNDGDEDEEEMRRRHSHPVHVNVVVDPRYLASAHPSLSALASAAAMEATASHPPGALFTADGDPIALAPHSHALFHTPSTLTLPPSLLPSSHHPTSSSSSPFLSRAAKRTLATDRRTLTRLLTLDAFFTVGWGALFVLTLMLPKSLSCPPGKYEGWCNAYNVAKAAGLGLALVSIAAFGLDVNDARELGRVQQRSGRV